MPFQLLYTPGADKQLTDLSTDKNLQKRFKSVKKALRFLENDPAPPSLNIHKYDSLEGPDKTEVFEAYAENNTPAAYRIFWCYYPPKAKDAPLGNITILAITPHPKALLDVIGRLVQCRSRSRLALDWNSSSPLKRYREE